VGAGTLEGTATYRERIALPPDAVFEAVPALGSGDAPLEILLVSAGAGRQPSSRAAADAHGIDVPASYAGEIAAATGDSALWHLDLLPEGRYQLRITRTDKPEPNRVDDIGRWRRESSTGRLLLRGGREAPLALVSSDGGRSLRTVSSAGPLERLPQPALIEPRLGLTGMFVYLADAAVITLCADGGRLPVVMEADYGALEAAYLKARRQPGQALLVSLEGLIALRPSAEAGRPPERSLVVERFTGVWPGESCGNPLVDSPLRGTYWKLVRLGEAPVEVAANQREPYLTFARDQLVSGSGGCNRVTGSFEVDGEKLQVGRLAATRMACPAGMEEEQRFLQSLGKVERYRIRGSHLELLDAAGAPVARFEAVSRRRGKGRARQV
jgi:copper homeostasis protein (lipoprotein)